MSKEPVDPLHQEFLTEIRTRVCGVCLDASDDRTCTLTRRVCAIEGHLPRLVAALSSVDSPSIADYEAAIRGQVCVECEHQEGDGGCELRDHGDCALDAYLPLVLDAVEAVRLKRGR